VQLVDLSTQLEEKAKQIKRDKESWASATQAISLLTGLLGLFRGIF